MSWKNLIGRLFQFSFAASIAVVLALKLAIADGLPVQAIDAGNVIARLSDSLAAGRKETAKQLERLGFGTEIQRMNTIDGSVVHTFSARSMIASLYRRAEIEKAGEGDRFLAILYNDGSKQSAAIAADPDFAPLKKFSDQDLKRPLKFSPLATIEGIANQKALPDQIERAINKLAEYYSGRQLAQVRSILRRVLKKEGFTSDAIDQAIASEKSVSAVLKRLFIEWTPPPRIEIAVRETYAATMAGSAAFQFDPSNVAMMEELSQELPPEYQKYAKEEDKLQSRVRQAAESSRAGKPGRDAPLSSKDVVANIEKAVAGLGVQGGGAGPQSPGPTSSGPGPNGPPPPPSPSSSQGSDPPKGGGSGGAGNGSGAYEKYVGETFEPRPAGSAPSGGAQATKRTPRTYKIAIMSPRAARGIAVGGKVASEIKAKPLRAAWIANKTDDRFGRLFVEMANDDGATPRLAASRVLFADSFYAALNIIAGKFDGESKFQDGQILVLMSMDPKSEIAVNARKKIEAEAIVLQDRIMKLTDAGELKQFMADMKAFEEKAKAAPRGVVFHPSLWGRELAWSTSRVDFWFNQIEQLKKEAQLTGGEKMPEPFQDISATGAVTWQFYERDAVISLGETSAGIPLLQVDSQTASKRSHFGISMFGKSKSSSDPENLESLPNLANSVQPLLDWLASNHHDFMRLNDFSEAFSLVRWLALSETPVAVVDMDGEGQALATPDRVVIGRGPGL
jgi:hypothetical protein